MKINKKNIVIILLSILVILLTIYICFKLIPFLTSLKNPQKQESFKNYIQSLGWKGWFSILAIQVLQIFIAFIPGEIIELLSGMLYGPLGGLFVCLIGIFIGSILIYSVVKAFANHLTQKYKDKLKTYSFLNNPKKIHIYFFILFIIPGIPKDIFIYLVPFLPIKFTSFLIVSLIARIPSILSSTIIGNSLANGNYLFSIIIFIIFTILGITGILFNDKIISLFSNRSKQINNNDTLEN